MSAGGGEAGRSACRPPRNSRLRHLSAKGFGRSVLALPQHPDKDRPQRPVLLAVDQELGERPRIEVSAISGSTTDYETANVSLEFVVKSTAV